MLINTNKILTMKLKSSKVNKNEVSSINLVQFNINLVKYFIVISFFHGPIVIIS